MCADQNLARPGPDKVTLSPQIRQILLNLTCFPSLDLFFSFLQRLNSPQVLAGEAPPPCVCGILGNGVLLQLGYFLLYRCEVSGGAEGDAPEDTCSVCSTCVWKVDSTTQRHDGSCCATSPSLSREG